MTPPTAPERCTTCDRLRPASPREKIREWARSDLTLREIEERDGMCIERGSSMCAPRAVDWRARAIAAEAERSEIVSLVSPSSDQSLPDAVRELCEHAEELRLAAAQWAKVAPLIERLRWPKSPHDEEQLVAAIFAATEATP